MSGSAQAIAREVMDIRQAAEYLGISADSLYRYASEGTVPAFRLGNRWRFKRSLLDAWMEQKSTSRLSDSCQQGSVALLEAKRKKPVARAQ